jgi:chromosome partitioning protein
VIAVANQKGGVAKTTTVHALGRALAQRGRRILLVDLDPQACLTWALDLNPDRLDKTLHDVLLGRCEAGEVLIDCDGLKLLPANIDLAGAEVHLVTRTGREQALARALRPVRDDFDIILIDCPPSLGILTICGLTAADEVLIPLQCESLSQRGLGQLMDTVADVREFTNPGLSVSGAIATMFDARTNLAKQVVTEVNENFGVKVFDPPVPRTVRVAESAGQGLSILEHAPRSKAADAYRALAEQIGGEP